jgi:type IV fimbrial biogenesis protein FimT
MRGFTLTELMVAVSVAAVLLGLGVPAFRQTLISNRLTASANEFMAALNYARSEAIRRGVPVALCKSSSGTNCDTGGNWGNKWEIGWMAFVDANKNDKWDSGEDILRTWPALPEGYTLRPDDNNFSDYLYYYPQGAAKISDSVISDSVTFALCYQEKREGAKAIVIPRLRPRLGVDSNGNKIPENNSGDDIASCFVS